MINVGVEFVKRSQAPRTLTFLGQASNEQVVHHQPRWQGKRSCIQADLKDVEDELKRMFEKHGVIENLVAKRNRNSDYCFAFAEMKEHSAAVECVKKYIYVYSAMIKLFFLESKSRWSSKMIPKEERIQSNYWNTQQGML